jgi:ribonuclease P protein component
MLDKREREQRRPVQFGKADFPKAQHLLNLSDFNYVKQHGKKYLGKLLVVLIAENRSSVSKLGLICGKKFSKKANARNRAKRMMREAFRLSKARLKLCEILMIPRLSAIKVKTQELQTDFIQLLKEAGKWKDS